MTNLSIALIVLNFSLVGIGLALWRRRLADPRRQNDAQSAAEADAKQSASLFNLVRETLFAHANTLTDLQRLGDADQLPEDAAQSNFNDLRRSNREAADCLDSNGKKIEILLKGYANLYQSERGRIDQYAQQTRLLDNQLANFEQDADGSSRVLLQLVREMLQENRQLRAKVSSCQEQVSELIVQSVKSNREARMDALTRLPNRRAWDERLDRIEVDGQTSVALIDVDDFKLINDQHGHPAGDGMLNMIGTVLLNSTQASAYRIGGDEFGLIISGSSSHGADHVAENLCQRIASSVLQFKGERIRASVSIGVARGVADEPIESVLFRADNALYAAKDAGGNQVKSNLNATPSAATTKDHVSRLVEA